MDAGILIVYERRYRPELPKEPNIGHIALASALGYLDFRFEGRWRNTSATLSEWLEAFENAQPAFAETKPRD